jgi:SpoIIAA-like
MSITYTEDAATKTFEITMKGRVTRADYDSIVDRLQAFIDRHGTVRMVEIIESFGGFDPSVLYQGTKFDFKNIRHISHVALVTDIGWLTPLAKATGALTSTTLRTFDMDQIEAARDWIRTAG